MDTTTTGPRTPERPRVAYHHGSPLLPAEPFRRHLAAHIERLRIDVAEFAEHIGVHERRVRTYLQQDWISDATVDRVLCQLDQPHMLRELYPELDVPELIAINADLDRLERNWQRYQARWSS